MKRLLREGSPLAELREYLMQPGVGHRRWGRVKNLLYLELPERVRLFLMLWSFTVFQPFW